MFAKMTIRLVFAAALSWGVAGVLAPAAAQQPTANAVALAKEMITLKGGNVIFERIVPGVIESAKNSLIPTNPNVGKELTEVANLLHKELEPKRSELLTEVSGIYAQRFTEQELKDMTVFYKSPLGQKMLKEEPAALDQSMKRAQDWSGDFSDAVLARFRTEMAKRGHPL